MNETVSDTTVSQAFTKVIEIATREWFDKVNGNSYWSAHVFVNTSPDARDAYVFTFQYGYDRHGESVVLDTLTKLGAIPSARHYDLKDAGVMVISHKRTGCRKSELMQDKDCKGMVKLMPAVWQS